MNEEFIMLQHISISDKYRSSELSIHQRSFQHNNNNKYIWAANKNFRMISEGSCDWNDDAKNSALKAQE